MPDRPSSRKVSPIFINGRFLTQKITGVQRYARETLSSLDELLGEMQTKATSWTLLVPPNVQAPTLKHIEVRRVGRFSGQLWEQLVLPWYARRGMLLNFGFTGPLIKLRQLITIHDAAVVRMPHAYDWRFRAWYRLVIGVISGRASRVLTVSRFSAQEAQDCFGVPASRLRVMTEGWQHLERVDADESILDRLDLRGKPYALAVSSPTANKNFALIASALTSMGANAPHCVAVGSSDASVFRSTEPIPGLQRAGYVTDGQLKALYAHATCFVFPSFYEGFGIPALEAMAMGCPVLASTATAVRETCGEAANYFDPAQPAELAACLGTVFSNPLEQARMKAAGLLRAQTFSWRRAAMLTLAALTESSNV